MLRQRIVHPQRLHHGHVEVRSKVIPCIPLGTVELILKTNLDNCARNPSFQPYASGGDGSLTQFCS